MRVFQFFVGFPVFPEPKITFWEMGQTSCLKKLSLAKGMFCPHSSSLRLFKKFTKLNFFSRGGLTAPAACGSLCCAFSFPTIQDFLSKATLMPGLYGVSHPVVSRHLY